MSHNVYSIYTYNINLLYDTNFCLEIIVFEINILLIKLR